ncbi:hypothetical protein [Mumia sp. DW29H23]|uniref:hypothetical protein n=1 Tax=Mumia sp. DW29H23 TaxID=3421241 RepID=UPI003D69D9D0
MKRTRKVAAPLPKTWHRQLLSLQNELMREELAAQPGAVIMTTHWAAHRVRSEDPSTWIAQVATLSREALASATHGTGVAA